MIQAERLGQAIKTPFKHMLRFLDCRLLQHIDSCGSALIPIKPSLPQFGPSCLCLAAQPESMHRPDRGRTAEDVGWCRQQSLGRSAAAPVGVEQGLPALPESLPVGALSEQDAQLVPPTLLPCGNTSRHEAAALRAARRSRARLDDALATSLTYLGLKLVDCFVLVELLCHLFSA